MKFFLMLAWLLTGMAEAAPGAEAKEKTERPRRGVERSEMPGFSWENAGEWTFALEGRSVTFSAPPDEDGKTKPMIVKYSYVRKSFPDGAALKQAMVMEIAKSAGATPPGEEPETCELVTMDGIEVVKTRAKVWHLIDGEKHLYRMVSFVKVGRWAQEEIMVAAPVDGYERWRKQLEATCATVKTREETPPDAKPVTYTAGPFSFEIKPGWWSVQGGTRLLLREVDREDVTAGMFVTYAAEKIKVTGAPQLMEIAEKSLPIQTSALRDLVGVVKGTGGPLRAEEIHTPSVEIFRSGGVDVVKGRFESVVGDGEWREAMKSVSLMVPDGDVVHILSICAPLEQLNVVAQEKMVAGVRVNMKASPSPAQTQTFKAGVLQCTLPGNWVKTDNPSVMAGPSQPVLGTNVETAVVAISQPKTFASLKQMKNEMDRRLENSMEQLRPLVGGAIGADGGLRTQELRNARAELITLGGTKVLRIRALETRELNGIRFMVDAVSYWVINGGNMDSLQIITPLATKEGSVVEKIVASMKVTGPVKE